MATPVAGYIFIGFWDCFRAFTFFLFGGLPPIGLELAHFRCLKPLLTQFDISAVVVMPLLWLSQRAFYDIFYFYQVAVGYVSDFSYVLLK